MGMDGQCSFGEGMGSLHCILYKIMFQFIVRELKKGVFLIVHLSIYLPQLELTMCIAYTCSISKVFFADPVSCNELQKDTF